MTERYWEKCGFREFKGKLELPIYASNIWCREANVYARLEVNESPLQVIFADCSAPNQFADGERLILRFQNFKPYLKEELINKTKENEVTIWLTKESAIQLKRFLERMFPEKLRDFL